MHCLRNGVSTCKELACETSSRYFDADATLQKRINVGRHGLRLTVEAFNMFNIAQRTEPNTNIFSTSLFGHYPAVDAPRTVQFTVQYDF